VSEQGREYLEKCAKIYTNDAHLSKTRIFKVLQSLATNYQLAVTTPVDTPSPLSFSDDDNRVGERRKRSNSIISIQSDGSRSLNGFKRMMDTIIEKAKKSPPPKQTRHLNQDAYFNSNDNTCNMQQKQSTLLNDPFASSFNSIGSTRPEDMFITSLSHGIGKTSAAAAATNSLSSSSSSPASSTPMYDDNKASDSPLDFDMLMSESQQPPSQPQQQSFVDNDLDKMLETLPLPYQQYDMASLTSEIPLWDLPSGVTWNDWEVFLKASPTTFP
jgi:hypothetical protein